MLGRFTNLINWQPLPVGALSPDLSLTADDGTWIKLPDFRTHLNVLVVFFRSPDIPESDRFLKSIQASLSRFQELETAVFGVTTYRPDALRAYRAKLALDFALLYDPLAVASRPFHASGRVRPYCKDTVALVGKDGKLLISQRGFPDVETILSAIATAEGKAVPAAPEPPPMSAASGGATNETLRTPGKPAAAVTDIDSKQALEMLAEKDTPYILVDVRTKGEFERERSPLARLIPVDEIPHRYAELKQTDHIIFVCQGGGRSAAAAEFMTSIGASHIYNVVGGMSDWTGPKISGAGQS